MKSKVLHWLLVLVLLAGNVIAWSTVYRGYTAFFQAGGRLLHFNDCLVTNPLATPCFYGAIGFFVALVWAATKLHMKGLAWFLLACTLFGWGNVAYEEYQLQRSSSIAGCGAKTLTSVFQSSCLYGTIAFTVALLLAIWIYRRSKAVTI